MKPASQARARRHELWAGFVNRPASFLVLALARHLGAVAWLPGIGRVVNDADVARAILMDPGCFNSHDRGSFGFMITRLLGPRALINMDGPEHQGFKRSLLDIFSPRYVSAVIDQATAGLVLELKASLRAGQTVDFARFMQHYGGAVACALIGVCPPEAKEKAAYEEIFSLATEIMALAGLQRQVLSPTAKARGDILCDQLATHIRASYEDGTAADLSVTQRLRAQGYAFEDVRGLVSVVLVGATELIIYGLPRMVSVMIDCGALPRLAAEPEAIDRAVYEAFRVVTPSNAILRAVVADCEVAGHRFRKGDRAIIAFCNIMRQPRYFAAPDVFDIDRVIPATLRRLPFGAGGHACLGVGLALTQTRHIFGVLMELGGKFDIVQRQYNRGKIYPGYTRLLIRLA